MSLNLGVSGKEGYTRGKHKRWGLHSAFALSRISCGYHGLACYFPLGVASLSETLF